VILIVDNYDSFTFNVVQALASLGAECAVRRNDAHPVHELLALEPRGLVLGPGPGRPADAGVCPELLRRAPADLPVLGVCLGHQLLVERWGGVVERDREPVHGYASPVHHHGAGLFAGLPEPFAAGRYHSLCARSDSLPAALELCAWTEDGRVMGVRHRTLPQHGVQFHPDSVLTPAGSRLFENFLELCAKRGAT
jgi:anthranilate synthase component 2